MYGKFVLPNWTVFSYMLKWVRKWSARAGDYFEFWYSNEISSDAGVTCAYRNKQALVMA